MAQPRARTPICCLDLDTFFVSVERLLDPSLVGRAVIVGARPNQRGVVSACSYEVRPLGVHSGMSTTQAARLAPDAVFLPTRLSLYAPYTQRVRRIIERFTPAVQTASIDEFYLDFAGCEGLYSRPQDVNPDATVLRVVRTMRQQIQTELGLPASGGVAANRLVAKIASRLAKPAGVCMIDPASARAIIGPMGVRAWPGIGPSTQRRLVDAGIETLDQLIDLPVGPHRAAFGSLSDRVRDAMGPTFRKYDGVDAVGSISNEHTFMADVAD
ncbi:MAG: DNA polymerase IV, partial [Oligoflexia bacterium]|nr:DNA polymerase IV [Oligoflexia bacterium]